MNQSLLNAAVAAINVKDAAACAHSYMAASRLAYGHPATPSTYETEELLGFIAAGHEVTDLLKRARQS